MYFLDPVLKGVHDLSSEPIKILPDIHYFLSSAILFLGPPAKILNVKKLQGYA